MECPCGSMHTNDECCGFYLSGNATAPSPEALMRSRYTAYACANIDYIMQTQRGKASHRFSKQEAKAWATSAVWLGLRVVHTEMQSHTQGSVEFIARFMINGKAEQIHEVSLFERRQGKWFYVDGEMVVMKTEKLA